MRTSVFLRRREKNNVCTERIYESQCYMHDTHTTQSITAAYVYAWYAYYTVYHCCVCVCMIRILHSVSLLRMCMFTSYLMTDSKHVFYQQKPTLDAQTHIRSPLESISRSLDRKKQREVGGGRGGWQGLLHSHKSGIISDMF